MAGRTLRLAALLGLLGLLIATAPARAGCTVSSSGVVFGAYSPFDPVPLDSTGTISYSCTLPVAPPSIQLGTGQAGDFAPRQLASGGDALDYNLFLDGACTTVWGDGSAGTSTHEAGAPADSQSYDVTVYGRIPALQNVRAGNYSDSVVVTIEF